MKRVLRNKDNRAYDYTDIQISHRDEYPILAKIIKKKSNVIDLGCGNGSLLKILAEERLCNGIGFDISQSGVEAARKMGLKVFHRRIDKKHHDIQDNQFDYAVCNVTIQMVMYPEVLMYEMGRIAKYQIVSFPNFAQYRNRIDLLIYGRMPRPLLYGYSWFSTGHIHQLSFKDFEQFCIENNFRILKRIILNLPRNRFISFFLRKFPNFFASECIYLLRFD